MFTSKRKKKKAGRDAATKQQISKLVLLAADLACVEILLANIHVMITTCTQNTYMALVLLVLTQVLPTTCHMVQSARQLNTILCIFRTS